MCIRDRSFPKFAQFFHMLKPYNGNVHRAAANIIVSKSRAARGSVCSTPDMGVILWGVSPQYIVSVSLLKVIIPTQRKHLAETLGDNPKVYQCKTRLAGLGE